MKTPEEIRKRIEELKTELQNFLMEANKQAAYYEGMIAALEETLREVADND